jgi:hypothetical protein
MEKQKSKIEMKNYKIFSKFNEINLSLCSDSRSLVAGTKGVISNFKSFF